MKKSIWMQVGMVVLALLFIGRNAQPPKDEGLAVSAFGGLPVKFEGRKKPVDTFARNFLTVLSGKQTLRVEGQKISATEWLLDNVAGVPKAVDYAVFRIESRDVLSMMGLEEKKGFRYSFRELEPGLTSLDASARSAWNKPKEQRDGFDRQVMKVANNLYLYQNVMEAFEDPSTQPADELLTLAQHYMQLETMSLPLMIPPHNGSERWRPLMAMLLGNHPSMTGPAKAPDELAMQLGMMLAAYRAGEVNLFNETVEEYHALLEANAPEALTKLEFEQLYNRLSAFMRSAELYVLVFLISCLGWMLRRESVVVAARTLMITAFVPHTLAIVARMFLSGYPPVTNLYSSAIFIGWGAVLVGIVLETAFHRRASGMGNLVGSIAGFTTLLIAHFLAGDGDTLEQMRAVLDTRFWLTTHVITITFGYTATFVAGVMGLFYLVAGLFSRRLDADTADGLVRMIYGVSCFALLLSLVGTILGGLWADDSWGRFWGWDPKENGALLIVIWNAIILHAWFGKMVQARGLAVMVVFGNVVTAWSWFGVNQLGVGLHSYGFTDKAAVSLTIFILSQLLVCMIGWVPLRLWRSDGPQG